MSSYLITGTSRPHGIGLTLATLLASLPPTSVSTVFATARTLTPAIEAAIAKFPGRIEFVPLNTTDEASIKSAVVEVERRLGGRGLDVLVNNAAVSRAVMEGPEHVTAENMDAHLSTNVTAVHQVIRAFLPLLRKGNEKKIVNISSTLGSIAKPHQYAAGVLSYAVSKAGLNALTVHYSNYLAGEGFVVFAISPGWLRTDLGGENADLPVEVGTQATLDKILAAGKESNGTFKNIHVKGLENKEGPNQYDGLDFPW